MNIVNALKKVKNDLFNFIVDGLNSKASVDHIHSYNDLTDLPIGSGYTNEEIDSLINSKIDVAIENLYPFEELNAPVIHLEQIVDTETNQ